MSLIEWNQSYELGILKLDNQHKQLVGMINGLHQAMRAGKGKEKIQGILDEMADYTVSHFKSEEILFDQYQYPQTEAHKNEHAEFVSKVMTFKNKFEKGDVFLSIEVIRFLQEWLVNHIKGSDQEYAPFLKTKGVN